MTPSSGLHVDDDGLRLPEGASGSCAVAFDGRIAWRFDAPGRAADGTASISWPPALRKWLHGRGEVTLSCGEESWSAGEVIFDGATTPLALVDRTGAPIVIDKWGLVQRSFADRDGEVVRGLARTSAEIIDLVRRETGIELWMAFGTLLGAMRNGHAIPHDSDVDLAYLSEEPTPARMIGEVYRIRQVLARAGYEVVNKSGSFLTIRVPGTDGRAVSIDIYTTFILDGLFYATATVRTPLAREAIVPLGSLEFEGVDLPAPARPDAVLETSYGPGWRVPDPGFHHSPGQEIVRRFESWFAHPMRQRRDWEIYWNSNWRPEHDRPDRFLARARTLIAEVLGEGATTTVIDLGAGRSRLAFELAADGHTVWAADYARDAVRHLKREAAAVGAAVVPEVVNLYDTRDALTFASLAAAEVPGPRILLARHLADAVPPYAREDLWRVARLLLRGGGRLLLEVDDAQPAAGAPMSRSHPLAGRRFEVTLERLREEWERAGLTAVEQAEEPVEDDPEVRHRWCIVLACGAPSPSSGRP